MHDKIMAEGKRRALQSLEDLMGEEEGRMMKERGPGGPGAKVVVDISVEPKLGLPGKHRMPDGKMMDDEEMYEETPEADEELSPDERLKKYIRKPKY